MKVTVYKCPWTGKLFEHGAPYGEHLEKLRTKQRWEREKARIDAMFDEFVAPLYQLETTDQIAHWLTKHYMKIALHFGPRWPGRKEVIPTASDYVVFEIPPLTFKRECSTTHCAPIGQRTTGWHRETNPHVPEAGWYGKIIMHSQGKAYNIGFCDSDHLKKIGINTGGGGGSGGKLSYELTLFTKDFPKLRLKAAVSEILQEHGRPGIDSNGLRLEPRWGEKVI